MTWPPKVRRVEAILSHWTTRSHCQNETCQPLTALTKGDLCECVTPCQASQGPTVPLKALLEPACVPTLLGWIIISQDPYPEALTTGISKYG